MDIFKQDPHLHSYYSLDVYSSPAYTLFHRQETPVKFYKPNIDCQFAQSVFEAPLPIAYEYEFTKCI